MLFVCVCVAISEFHEIKSRSEIWNHVLKKKRCAIEANLASVLNSIDSPLLLTAVLVWAHNAAPHFPIWEGP